MTHGTQLQASGSLDENDLSYEEVQNNAELKELEAPKKFS